jgi:hypothetical protein
MKRKKRRRKSVIWIKISKKKETFFLLSMPVLTPIDGEMKTRENLVSYYVVVLDNHSSSSSEEEKEFNLSHIVVSFRI